MGRKARLAAVAAAALSAFSPASADDLTSRTPFALFDDAALVGRGLRRAEAGVISLPDGRVAVLDPLVYPDRPPLARKVPPGDYRVTLVYSPTMGRNALGVLHVTDGAVLADVAAWEVALQPGQSAADLSEGEYYGFPVDAGAAGFAASDYGAATEARSRASGYDEATLDAFLELGYGGGEALVERLGEGGDERVRMIGFHSGWGDGYYPSLWALDDGGAPLALVIDLLVIEDGGGFEGPHGYADHALVERERRDAMGEAGWRDAEAARDALDARDEPALERLVRERRVSAQTYLPERRESLAVVAVRDNAAWAIDILNAAGASDRLAEWDIVADRGTANGFARWLDERSRDRSSPYPPPPPRTPELLAATARWSERSGRAER